MKRLALAVALLLSLGATAAPVSAGRAAAAAAAFWQAVGPQGPRAATLDVQPTPWAYDGIYLFRSEAGGWVIVAADDAAYPILGYATTGTLDPARLPVQLEEWLTSYQQQIDWLRDNDGQPYTETVDLWAELDRGSMPPAPKSGSVEPLLTTRWDQTAPYNEQCPPATVTGCAATAQAQMMKYWNHPAIGTGSHRYLHPRYGELIADFGHTPYAWSLMPDEPTEASPAAERAAVAQLMYHVGVSLEMVYGTAADGGSSAIGLVGMPGYASIDNSLQDYFGYSREMYPIFRDNGYTDELWRAALIDELDQRHPVIYAGAAEQGGHGFVCDGYDEREYLHFNFGWSGIGDGYYRVDSISPGVGGAGGNVTYTFNLQNSALIGAVPVYRMMVSDTVFSFGRDGGVDSVLFAPNAAVNSMWEVSSTAEWLSVESFQPGNGLWVHIVTSPNTSGAGRVAWLHFVQGTDTLKVKVAQTAYSEEEMCPVKVVMESTHGSGWQGGAYLSLESLDGFVFGTATLESGSEGVVSIPVAPHDVRAVWHRGGGTDRYINYLVRNQYNETLVEVNYAYQNGGTHFIEWPCSHVGIETPSTSRDTKIEVYPNPAGDQLHVRADGLTLVELHDVSGRRVLSTDRADIDLRTLPAGPYFVRLTTEGTTTVKRIVKR